MDCMTSPSDHPELCDDAELHVADLADDWDLSDGTDILMEEAGVNSAAGWQTRQAATEQTQQAAGDGSSSDSQEVAAQQPQQEPAAALPVMVPQSTAGASAFSGCMVPQQQQQLQQQGLSVAIPAGYQGQDMHGMISPAGSNTAAVYPVDPAAASMYQQHQTMQQMMAMQGYAGMQQQYMMHPQQQYWQAQQQQAYQMMYVNWVPAPDAGGEATAAEPVDRQQQQQGGKAKHSNKRARGGKNGGGHYSSKACNSDDEDSEEARAAAAAAAAAIASGAIQLNPNVHPAAAAAAAADAARAAARAAARKAAATAAASARKKHKAKAAAVKVDCSGSISDSDECHPGAQQQSDEGAGRQKRKAASGVTKAVAAVADDDQQTEQQLDTEAQMSPAEPAAGVKPVAQPTSSKTAQSDETAVGSSALSPDAPDSGAAAAAAHAAAPAPAPVSIDDHLDDPIMMELYKHEMSIAQALAGPAAKSQQQQKNVAAVQRQDSTVAAPTTCESPTAAAGAAAATDAVKPTSSSSSGVAEAATGAAPAAPPCSVSTPDSTAAAAAAATVTPPEDKPLEKLPAAAAATPTATPVVAPLKRQQSGNVPAAASSACDSEGSVFTASSRTSISITSSQSAPGTPLVSAATVGSGGISASRSFGLKGTGLPAPAFEQGYYVTFTAANGQQQQVLVQPAGHSSSRSSSSGSDLSGVTAGPVASMGMMGSGVTHPGYTAAAAAPPLHHNPVVAAMLAQMQSPGNCPILHATMAALANPAGCTCVYCVTSGKSHRSSGGYMPVAAGVSAPLTAAAPKPASSAMLMPPPRPVMMPGKPAAAAATNVSGPMPNSQAAVGSIGGFGSTAATFVTDQSVPTSTAAAAAGFSTLQSGHLAADYKDTTAAAAAASMAVSDVPHHDWSFDDIDVDDLDFTLDHTDYTQHDAAIVAAAAAATN